MTQKHKIMIYKYTYISYIYIYIFESLAIRPCEQDTPIVIPGLQLSVQISQQVYSRNTRAQHTGRPSRRWDVAKYHSKDSVTCINQRDSVVSWTKHNCTIFFVKTNWDATATGGLCSLMFHPGDGLFAVTDKVDSILLVTRFLKNSGQAKSPDTLQFLWLRTVL